MMNLRAVNLQAGFSGCSSNQVGPISKKKPQVRLLYVMNNGNKFINFY
ncbi:hypothetical protein [Serratia proteamaculans]